MFNRLDFIELKTLIANQQEISNDLIKKVILDSDFQNLDFGADILYIIERCNIIITVNNIEQTQNYINTLIDQMNLISTFSYTDNEVLLFKKYMFYKYLSFQTLDTANIEKSITDLETLLSIPINKNYNTSAWLAKENLRLILLEIYANSINIVNYKDQILTQLEIARGVSMQREELENLIHSMIRIK